jgi:hypothetical protein
MKLLTLRAATRPSRPACSTAQDWQPLFNGKNLDGWEVRGESTWTVLPDGVLLGQRSHPPDEPCLRLARDRARSTRSWLYRQVLALHRQRASTSSTSTSSTSCPRRPTAAISIRDVSRAHYVDRRAGQRAARLSDRRGEEFTPAHIGYEIQLIDGSTPEKYPTGSIYTFVAAPATRCSARGPVELDWTLRAAVSGIRVKVNGTLAAEYRGRSRAIEGRPDRRATPRPVHVRVVPEHPDPRDQARRVQVTAARVAASDALKSGLRIYHRSLESHLLNSCAVRAPEGPGMRPPQ